MTLTPSRISVSQSISDPVQTRFNSTGEGSVDDAADGASMILAGAVFCDGVGDEVTGCLLAGGENFAALGTLKLKNPRTWLGARVAGFDFVSSSDDCRTRTKYEYDGKSNEA